MERDVPFMLCFLPRGPHESLLYFLGPPRIFFFLFFLLLDFLFIAWLGLA
jgi:hypothetical protein